ncbi:SET domain-containing protein 9 [Gossypium australe]|uniref:SET domain-containing protein 9 n=1 Tax=Gossypium australe TaxID=47621 RepID=A0A5B6WL92_9ROSI|nr:SET domain-containing protein 9 [Gossypium australe]
MSPKILVKGRTCPFSSFFSFSAVRILAKSPTFARYRRKLQFEDDINLIFMYTSYNRLGKNADEADAEEIIDMASKASFTDQQMQVQENVHFQIKNFCTVMDEILLPGSAVPLTRPIKRAELSLRLKDSIGYSLDVKPSQIPHNEASQGLYLNGEANVGAVIAIYPGVIYSPSYYQYIPGYPRVDARNRYLITRYDGIVIDAQPWGYGGETREIWDSSTMQDTRPDTDETMLGKALENSQVGCNGEILERRNPLALAHFANHSTEETVPNVMVCPYDFPLTEKNLRTYIPNISFGNAEEQKVRRLGSSWFRGGSRNSRLDDSDSDGPVLKTLVLVAAKALCDEEVLLQRPLWYYSVDEDED